MSSKHPGAMLTLKTLKDPWLAGTPCPNMLRNANCANALQLVAEDPFVVTLPVGGALCIAVSLHSNVSDARRCTLAVNSTRCATVSDASEFWIRISRVQDNLSS